MTLADKMNNKARELRGRVAAEGGLPERAGR